MLWAGKLFINPPMLNLLCMHHPLKYLYVIWPLQTCQELGYQFETQSISLPPSSLCLTVINEGTRSWSSCSITFSHLPWAWIFVCSPKPLSPPFFHDRPSHPQGAPARDSPLPTYRRGASPQPAAPRLCQRCLWAPSFPFRRKGAQPLPAPGAPLFFSGGKKR